MAIFLKSITGELLSSIEGNIIKTIRVNALYGAGGHIKLTNFEAFLQLLGNSILIDCPRPDKIGPMFERTYPELEISFNL